ncbi:MAG: 3-deoxy-manno-octulosonate cytidylyltransferase [Gemmatales bacterium]|nr:MAG: 3-deoxy-manno-octulosonate cytidylyltransferase [Gemmatales bacterium]
MDTVAVICSACQPDCYPALALLQTTGKTLVEHSYELAKAASRISDVVVVTDNEQVGGIAQSLGVQATVGDLTPVNRLKTVAQAVENRQADCVVVLNADNPTLETKSLDLLVDTLAQDSGAQIAGLVVPIRMPARWQTTSFIKAVADQEGRLLYLSRSPIPYVRDGAVDFTAEPPALLEYIEVSAYRLCALRQLAQMPPHPLEIAERIPELRAVLNAWPVRLALIGHGGCKISSFDDYDFFVQSYKRSRAA